ncbi:dimethylsulfide monooxygenase, small subunit [Xaviernesmea oryzae]|uniref:Dimethylsulfide monooxygenase, small subunit n=1 Tax=Xaviernesmea oryzae TaxID=464029 RepID=A0A1X7G1X2_9HYPH|nr:flavin reductase family protein [Xaviernesmea oryzae]SMF62538.1 dimethylsulfide monooxygenase, small subunit [Xaviernesmea oryzae]
MTNRDLSTTVDRDTFRHALRSVASSVAVITTCHEGHLHGMTATAFSSVCADPPTVLIVVNQSTRSHPLISDSRAFVVNFLSQDQRHLGDFFSAKTDDQFDSVAFTRGRNGCPIIDGAAAYLDCETISESVCGTHTVFLARVVGAFGANLSPLLYHNGAYRIVGDAA